MRVFKYPRFHRFTKKEGITDSELLEIVKQLETGHSNADLGGGVYKERLARAGEGKSGGHRIILYFKNEFRTFFVYGFSKADRDNISEGELRAFKIDAWLKQGTLIEIT